MLIVLRTDFPLKIKKIFFSFGFNEVLLAEEVWHGERDVRLMKGVQPDLKPNPEPF